MQSLRDLGCAWGVGMLVGRRPTRTESIGGRIILRDEQIDDFIDIMTLSNIDYIEIIKIDKAVFNIPLVKSVLNLTF